MIEIRNLSAGYRGKHVLEDVSIDFRQGEVLVLLGPNGCGKSTLLKAALGILDKVQGEICYDGRSIDSLSRRQIAQRVAFLTQSRTTPVITALRMVLHGRFPYLSYPRHYGKRDYEIARQALEQVGAAKYENRSVGDLSGGQRQAVYLAMALAQDTQTILMDEPTTYLDVAHQLRLMEMARKLAKDGKAVVMVLHDLTQALQIADRVVVMKAGRIISQGTAEDVYADQSLEQAFGVKIEKLQTKEGEIIWHYSHFL